MSTAGHVSPVALEPRGRRVARRLPIGQFVLAAIVAAVVLQLVAGFATNPAVKWHVVGQYILSPVILSGLWTTIWLTFALAVVGIVVGTVVAVMRVSSNPVLMGVAWVFLWLFRAIPALVWLLFWYFLAILVPTLSLGIPFGPTLWEAATNDIIGRAGAAVLGLGLVEAAYMAEVIRGGIVSVGAGQMDAALAVGMTRRQAMFRVVLPQALRAIVPGLGNQLITLTKATSLVLIIGVPDLMTNVQEIYSANFEQIPLLVVACAWYLAITSLISLVQYFIEAYAARSGRR